MASVPETVSVPENTRLFEYVAAARMFAVIVPVLVTSSVEPFPTTSACPVFVAEVIV